MMPHTLPPRNGQIPVLGQRQQAAEQGVAQAVHSLSLSIYARIAAETLDPETPPNVEHLRHLAKGAMTAARCYFEGLGVIEQTPQGAKPQTAPETTQTPSETMDSGL